MASLTIPTKVHLSSHGHRQEEAPGRSQFSHLVSAWLDMADDSFQIPVPRQRRPQPKVLGRFIPPNRLLRAVQVLLQLLFPSRRAITVCPGSQDWYVPC